MNTAHGPCLGELLVRFSGEPGLGEPVRTSETDASGIEEAVRLYSHALPLVERALWAEGLEDDALALFQGAFREYEGLLAQAGKDERHRFIVIVPVADRPQHLNNFLASLLELCRTFEYGGEHQGRYRKVSVIVADDSADPAIIRRNRELTAEYRERGLDTTYFGAQEQQAELQNLTGAREALGRVVAWPERTGFSHKGASITRNIAYLSARRLMGEDGKTLVWFVDSDEQFRVRTVRQDGVADVTAINYFHHLDRIFSQGHVHVLTGKVVGDPPVSPSVMAGNFLSDVMSFLRQMSERAADAPCGFHDQGRRNCDDAAYHDMADLFGFKQADDPYVYHCGLAGEHDHAACLRQFSTRLDSFFDGEHPTRESYFEYGEDFPGVKPARTVYTGNYVFDADGLRYFIPFASLKLRMAGPVLGRIVKAEIGDAFVSANLPLLHTRTVDGDERFEFRPGVRRQKEAVDLSGEFERQFFGDVMLFTVERLAESGYPARIPSADEIDAVIDTVEADMLHRYTTKQAAIAQRLDEAAAVVDGPEQWWNRTEGQEEAVANLRRFLANLRANFGDDETGYALIRDPANRARRRREIREAIASYGDDRDAWEAVVGERP